MFLMIGSRALSLYDGEMIFLFFFLAALSLRAQDFSFLSPRAPGSSFDAEGFYFPHSALDHGPEKNEVLSTSVGASHRFLKKGAHEVSAGARWTKLNFSPDEELRDYQNIQGSMSYKTTVEEKLRLFSLSYGSASDRPFRNGRDNTLSANYFHQFNRRWFGVVNYSNNRAFLNNIPLPGFLYIKEMTPERSLVVGFPVIYWVTQLSPSLSLRYFGVLPWTHRLRVAYTALPELTPYFSFEHNPQSYFRHDRENVRDRFFWVEKRLALGLELPYRGAKFDVASGWAFDRQFFEARNFSESKSFLYNLENSYFISLSHRYQF
jgi:hypothetical protein